MKHPSDMPMLRFKHGGSDMLSNTLLLDHGGATAYFRERLVHNYTTAIVVSTKCKSYHFTATSVHIIN